MQALLMRPEDNVALATEALPAGQIVNVAGQAIPLRQTIPFGHKLAVRPIPAGELAFKYGQPIGRATADIAVGDHVHVHNVESLRGRGDLDTAAQARLAAASTLLATAATPKTTIAAASQPPATAFLGYRRRDGRVGVRNHVLVLASVQCANVVVDHIARRLPPLAIATVAHAWGCSQIGADLAQTLRTLEGFALHPNVGAVLLVGLGCETLPTAEIAAKLDAAGIPHAYLVIQEEGGSRPTIERGTAIVKEFLAETSRAKRERVPLAELIVGVECGGSDAWSGITANPAVGAASDLLVQAGGTVILSETPEFIGAEHLLAERAVSPEVARRIVEAVKWHETGAARMGVDMRGTQPTPGNIAGGLTSIEEKSLGAITKGGSTPVQEFVPYAVRPMQRGLVIMDTPGNDPESVTGMVAGGAQVVVFTTGRGTPTGCPIAPVIKVATNSAMYRRLHEDMDLDAGTIVEQNEPLPAVGQRIFDEIVAAANGKETAAERLGTHEFAINVIGPRL